MHLTNEKCINVSSASAGLYMWVKNMITLRAMNAIVGHEVVVVKTKTSLEKPKTAKKALRSKTAGPVRTIKSTKTISKLDAREKFVQSSVGTKKHLEAAKDDFGRQTYFPEYDRNDLMRDSPTRRRLIIKNKARNSMQAEYKVYDDNRRDPFDRSSSYNHPDLNYNRYRDDVMMDTAIHKERMKAKNINKTKSRVNFHWSPKRRREMREEGNYMTNHYAERFIKDVIKDVHDRRISYREGEEYLHDVGYDLELNSSPSGVDHITAVRIAEEDVLSESPVNEGQEKVLHKELMLGKDLIRTASNHITGQSIFDLAHDNLLSIDDQQIVKTFIGLLELVNLGRPNSYPTWYKVQSSLSCTRDWIDKIDDFERMIEHYSYSQREVSAYKDSFKKYAQKTSNKLYVSNIREFLCEAFCLLDIVNELRAVRSPTVEKSNQSPAKHEKLENRSSVKAKEETKADIIPIKEANDEGENAKSDDLDIAYDGEAINFSQGLTQFQKLEAREVRHRIVHSRSPVKQVSTKTFRKG
jgi:hypothetical protein